MLKVWARDDVLWFGDGFSLTFQRTLRIPDDARTYPLPPGLGSFPILTIEDYRDRVPERWLAEGGFFIPMYQREAMWISFRARHWKPNAVKVGIGRINAVSGEAWDEELSSGRSDYMVCPPQLWLDGINAGEEYIRQFVAMPLGAGYSVEAQLTGEERFGGMQIVVYEPRPGVFPDRPPPRQDQGVLRALSPATGPMMKDAEMGLAAGGKMRQKIYPDPHGLGAWDPEERGSALIRIVNSLVYQEVTGTRPPSSPISAKTYTQYGLPWFDLYDEAMKDIEAPEKLKQVKSVGVIDEEKGLPSREEPEFEVPEGQVKKYVIGPEGVEEDEE